MKFCYHLSCFFEVQNSLKTGKDKKKAIQETEIAMVSTYTFEITMEATILLLRKLA